MGTTNSGYRNVGLTLTGDMPVDAMKAAIKRIEDIEYKYFQSPASVTDLTAKKTVLTGDTPFKIYVFDVTIVKATGDYTFAFVEEAPNVETATSL